MDFTDELTKLKPNMSAGSVKTYNSLLRTIYKNVFGNNDVDLNNFKNYIPVLEYLNKKPFNTRKSYLSALVAITPDVEIYKKEMMENIKTYNEEVNSGETNDTLVASELTKEEIDDTTKRLKTLSELALKKKPPLVINDLMDIQNYVIISLYLGHIVPRRLQDYTEMLVRNYTEDDNYLDIKNHKFVFNKYKTAQKMGKPLKGTQELIIPPSLMKILKKWIAVIPDDVDTLLFSTKLQPLTNVTLNQRLNSIFNKKASVNAIRHYYLTQNYKATMVSNDLMSEDMNNMGSSILQAKVYIKTKDAV